MKKRLMAFLLAVVTTVGSLPMAPVFAEEDEFVEVVVEDEEVVEDAGSVSAGKLNKLTVVSKNGAEYSETDLNEKEVKISANQVLSLSANLVSTEAGDLEVEGVNFKAVASIETASGNYAELTKDAAAMKVDGNALYTVEDIQIKGISNGVGTVTIKVVSQNETGWVEVNKNAEVKFELTVVKVDDEETTTPDDGEGEQEQGPVSGNEVDPEVAAEAQKDAEGFDAFTSIIDIDPEAQFQEIYMVAKQSFTSEALKGFDYANADTKKADKKIVTISKKGKITAKKKAGKVTFSKDGKIISVNVVVPVMPNKKAKVSVDGGKTETIKLTGLEATPSVNVVFISSDPTKASVSYDSAKREAYVTGIVKGKVNVIAYVNGKTYKTPVKINSNAETAFVGYINKGVKNKAIKATGVKKWEIISANEAVLTLNAKGTKFTAGVAGAVSVNGLNKKGEKVVTGWIYVQDLDLKLASGKKTLSVNGVDVNADKKLNNVTKESKRGANKTETYEITIKLDQTKNNNKIGYAKIDFANYAQKQAVVLKSSKAANVYYNGNGVIVARKAYKKPIKLTGKVNGKKLVIKVKVEE